MGFMEAAVVIYLRKIYYPIGFDFPLQFLDANIAIVEILREAATLIMLISIGILTGRTRIERFAHFLFCFAVWDIIYYLILFIFLGWPPSLLTWDVLFLIPTTWTGPVLGPIINSVTMIVLALVISLSYGNINRVSLSRREWFLLIGGSLIVIASYMEDYFRFMLQNFSLGDLLLSVDSKKQIQLATQYTPVAFSWWKFILGEGLILSGIFMFYRRIKKPL